MASSGPREVANTDYDLLERQIVSLLADERDFLANSANFAAFIFMMLPEVNWAGFYFPDVDGLVLGPFGGKPACTRLPKGRGVCNRAFQSAASVRVDDVNALADHIACDSASRSEMVVPLLHEQAVYGVFDIDSPIPGRFTERDTAGVERLVAHFVRSTPLPQRYRTDRKANVRVNDRIDIQTCRDHHIVLRYLVEDLAAPENSPAQNRALLARIRTVLLAHLKLENGWLYPRLLQSENAIVRGKAERYRPELAGLGAQFDTLWKRWSAPGALESDSAGWQSDWHRFSTLLVSRIETEDHDLYVAAEADLRLEDTGAVGGD